MANLIRLAQFAFAVTAIMISSNGLAAQPSKCHIGSTQPCPRAAAVTFGREKLKATTKTQGDFNLANSRPSASPPPAVSKSKTVPH